MGDKNNDCCLGRHSCRPQATSVHHIRTWIGIIIFTFYISLFVGVYFNYQNLPTPLMISDQVNYPNSFIAENAQNYLVDLARIGVKVGGSQQNDYTTVTRILEHLDNIQASVQSNIHTFEKQFNRDGSSFELKFSPYGMTTVYRDVSNVVVKLSPAMSDTETENCILLNSHFDTMPDTEGASDAIAMIATMLEILRVTSNSSEPFKHCLVFLFNGGEENYMLGSHAFITEHTWASNVRAFINMDSAGAGGKEIMYQAGQQHSFLMKYYRDYVPYPHTSAMAEELFQNNFIPSDSDFRIFRDFGNIPGMDFAFNANGYVYHTKYDAEDLVPLGTLQHVGSNVLALVKALANSDELYDIEQHADGKAIFFDYQGWFMLFYSDVTGIIINCVLSVFGLCFITFSLFRMSKVSDLTMTQIGIEYLLTILIQILSIIIGIGLTIALAIIYDTCNRSMSWFANPWLIGFIYVAPFFFGLSIGPIVWINCMHNRMQKLSLAHKVQLFLHAQCFLYIILIIILTSMRIRSAFVILISMVFYLASTFINAAFNLQNKVNGWLYSHLFLQIFPIMFYQSLLHLALQTFIPIVGRDGPDSNPEILITIFSIGMCLLMGGFIIPLISLFRSPKFILCIFAVLTIIGIILMVTPIGFPYREATEPQRYWIQHTHRVMHNFNKTTRRDESGYYLQAMDRHTPNSVSDYVPEIQLARSTSSDCKTELYCGLPLLSSRKHVKSDVSFWIPATPPYLRTITELSLVSLYPEGNVVRFTFQITGPNHMGVFISPEKDVTLIDWSLLNYIPESGPEWNGRKTYFVYFNYGYGSAPDFIFYLEFQLQSNYSHNQPTFDIALVSHYLFHEEDRTVDFQAMLNKFPKWTYQMAWISSYESFVY